MTTIAFRRGSLPASFTTVPATLQSSVLLAVLLAGIAPFDDCAEALFVATVTIDANRISRKCGRILNLKRAAYDTRRIQKTTGCQGDYRASGTRRAPLSRRGTPAPKIPLLQPHRIVLAILLQPA
jgi:hypothetical protein